MKVALVTTPPSVRSGIGDYTRHLLPYLRESCDVELFVEPGLESETWEGERPRSASDLAPRQFDQILYQLGNEGSHAFMLGMVRAIGGTVMQHDWVLFDLAAAAWPALERGGLRGWVRALREGGLAQARIYGANRLARRNQRSRPEPLVDHENLSGVLLGGWHEPEPKGRWVADQAVFRVPARGVRRVAVQLATEPGRRVQLTAVAPASAGSGARETWTADEACAHHTLELALDRADEPVLVLATGNIEVSAEQRSHGDARRLGSFVEAVRWTDADGEHEVDLAGAASVPIRPVDLARDRFRLPFNRSVVRFADAFVVHSRYVKDRILRERNSLTPVGIVHHGAEIRWRDDDRRAIRADLGLPDAWRDSFLVVSFGGVQPHKRIDRVLAAIAEARRTGADVRMCLAGKWSAEEMDPPGLARSLGVADSVHFAGFVPEERAWDLIHAGDVCVNLRGPTSGGTSGGIFQSFAQGRAIVATDAAEQSELPDACAIKVPLGEGEVEAVAAALVALQREPQRLAAMESAVRRFVETECHWGVVAREYAELLGSFPRPRSNRRSLISMRAGLDRLQHAAS